MIPTSRLEIRDRWRLLEPTDRAVLIRTVVPGRIRRARRKPQFARPWPREARQDGRVSVPPATEPVQAPTEAPEGTK